MNADDRPELDMTTFDWGNALDPVNIDWGEGFDPDTFDWGFNAEAADNG